MGLAVGLTVGLSPLLLLLQLIQQLLRGALSVALRVVLGPAPQVLAGVLEGELGLPGQLVVGAGGVGGQVEDVAGAAANDGIGKVAADGGAEGFDHVEDGAALAGAEVPGPDAWVLVAQVVERGEVAAGQVEDVDVVADGGAVVGGVVCGKLGQNTGAIGTSTVSE